MKTKICIPITAKTTSQASAELKEAEKLTDLVELRIDYINGINEENLEKLLINKKGKVIITNRIKSENGKFKGSEKERMGLLKKAIELNADYIDIESSAGKEAINELIKIKNKTKIISSYHNFKETPSLKELEEIYNKIKELNPDLIKIVTFANSINDNFEIFKLLKNKNDLVSFCMGLRGQMSRILASKYGSCITFASLKKDKESAPGQISIEEMDDVYNASLIKPETKVLGVIGEFAENSKSKYMHNKGFKQKKLDFVYLPFKVKKEELKEFMENFRKLEFAGGAVTVPHKTGIINYLDEVDDTADKIGAVNTFINKGGRLIGYNTDYYGAVQALKEKTGLNGKKVLIIGAGGAARAVVYGLKKEDAEITIANRTSGKAEKLAKEFKVGFKEIKNMKELIAGNDIIINTTSVGMHPRPDDAVIKEDDLSEKLVMDIVSAPIITKLIRLAKKNNCDVITGDRMLVHQAIGQFRLWTGKEPDFKIMEKALLDNIER